MLDPVTGMEVDYSTDSGTAVPIPATPNQDNSVWTALSGAVTQAGNFFRIATSAPNPFPGTFGSFPQAQAKPGQGVTPVATPVSLTNTFKGISSSLGLGSGVGLIIVIVLLFLLLRK